jgi:Fe-S oxidoreductase
MKSLSKNARIPKEMKIPKLFTNTLREKYYYLTEEYGKKSNIAYFHGCANNYIDNGIGESVIEILSKNGFDITLPKQKCSGTPILTYGSKDIALENIKFNIDSLIKYEKIITSCASCNLMLKEYTKYFDNGYLEKAIELKNKVFDISEFILKNFELKHIKSNKTLRVTYHSSCHLKVAGVSKEPKEIIKKIPNIEFIEMRDETRCAGGAGSFIVKDYEKSKEIFWRKERAIKEIKPDIVLTSCPACQIQLKDKLDSNIEVKSVVSFLNECFR